MITDRDVSFAMIGLAIGLGCGVSATTIGMKNQALCQSTPKVAQFDCVGQSTNRWKELPAQKQLTVVWLDCQLPFSDGATR